MVLVDYGSVEKKDALDLKFLFPKFGWLGCQGLKAKVDKIIPLEGETEDWSREISDLFGKRVKSAQNKNGFLTAVINAVDCFDYLALTLVDWTKKADLAERFYLDGLCLLDGGPNENPFKEDNDLRLTEKIRIEVGWKLFKRPGYFIPDPGHFNPESGEFVPNEE